MGHRVEQDGYTAELSGALEVVYRNPHGRALRKLPDALRGAPGLDALHSAAERLEKHDAACLVWAREWARTGASVPRALADADPLWRAALEGEGSTLTDDAGEGGLFARTYTGFSGHTLTQLLPEQVIPYRDVLMRIAHWEPDGLFSTGIPDASDGELPFPERVIAAHPGQEESAARKVRALELTTDDWRRVTKHDVDGVLGGPQETAPALLATLLDELADLALQQGDGATAAAWFGRARETERLQGLKADQEWLQGRYLTYAGAKALPASALRARARELAVKGVATEADLARFRAVVLRRVRATSEAYPQLAVDLRKIARAAGLSPDAELATLLQEILAAGGVTLEEEKFWTECLKGRALELLADRGPETLRHVLELRPGSFGEGRALWPQLLARTGALPLLTGAAPGLPDGAAAAWLADCIRYGSDQDGPWLFVYDLAERIAPRLAADGVPLEFRYWSRGERQTGKTPLDLIDVLLEHGAPVADPPELFGWPHLNTLLVARRPELAHLQADERFARELRAWVRAHLDVDATVNRYRPQSTTGRRRMPGLLDNPTGHEELRAWCARERAKLRAGVDLDELALLLGRFAHVGAAVDVLLEDAEAAQEFTAVDVMALLMAKMPEGVSRAQAAELLETVRPDDPAGDGDTSRSRGRVREALPQLGEPAVGQVARDLITAVNCRTGLERLVRRFTPGEADEGGEAPVPTPRRDDPEVAVSRQLMKLAESGAPVWDGDLAQADAEFTVAPGHLRFLGIHAHAAPLALCAVSARRLGSDTAYQAGRSLLTYATHPFVSGKPGRWRIVHCEIPTRPSPARAPARGTAFTTATSAACVMDGGSDPHRTLWEYAPDGAFPEDGPLAAAGARLTRAYVLEPVRPGSWFVRFAELYRRHGSAPPRPALARAFAERLGQTVAEATVLLMAYVPAAPHQVAEERVHDRGYRVEDLEAWQIREKEAEHAVHSLTSALGPEFFAALYDKLLPDDPEDLWTAGPDVDRAAGWWRRELGSPLPVPAALLPLAIKETLPTHSDVIPHWQRSWRERERGPALRLPALTGRVAAGADCLSPDPSGLGGEPQLPALPRIAAWLAYRTPAGDPLRPAIGAAIARLRAELAAGPGPLTLFSLQCSVAGAAPATAALTAHPAVTQVYDDGAWQLRVDPAALKGTADPLLDSLDTYLDTPLPSQWQPSPSGLPAVADLRLLLSDDFAALGGHLTADDGRTPGWEQHPARSVPPLVEECATTCGLGEDPAALYLMLLALPDPTDRNVRTWTAWSPVRFKAAVAELEASGLVRRATRTRAGRALFLPGSWQERKPPRLPIEASKLGLLPLAREHRSTSHMAAVPSGPVPALFARAWAGRGG
ncbi:hypothetical protein AB0D04_12905 [Streptomyces sp. NPDC048483]|uniref:hypothetical protein n=1 Tax=Streptomyces sp. NPDC048483 TaxID=3154927 RepID=UPI003419C121